MEKIYGIATNDSGHKAYLDIKSRCPFLSRWIGMLERCYSSSFHARNPSYVNCSVCDEWLTFSNFKRWMEKQDWQGMALDKDLMKPGNTVYSPDCCAFIPQRINNLLTDNKARRGTYPVGVSYKKQAKKFQAQCRDGSGKNIHLGYFETPEQARESYVSFKIKVIESVCMEMPLIEKGLKMHIEILKGSKQMD